jgi:hypothetical protein
MRRGGILNFETLVVTNSTIVITLPMSDRAAVNRQLWGPYDIGSTIQRNRALYGAD